MEAILFIGIIQSLFGSLIIFSFRKRHLANKVLTLWLFTIAAIMFEALLKEHHIGQFNNTLQSGSVVFIFGPLLYLYTRNLMVENPAIKKTDAIHFIPFTLFAFLSILFNRETISLNTYWFSHDRFFWLRMIFSLSVLVSLLTYTFWVFKLIKNHYINLKNHFSYTSEKINLLWPALLATFFTLGYISTLSAIIYQTKKGADSNQPLLVYYSVLTLFSYGIGLFGYRQPLLFGKQIVFESSDYTEPKEVPETIPTQKYEKSGLKPAEAEKFIFRILGFMESDKPYQKGDLTIQDLSDKLNIPKHYITQILNEKMGKNFYTFINEYRVTEFKIRLNNPQYKNYTILGIAYDCGFNSKSSFNAIFKQFTGKTPSQYKKDQPEA